MRSKWSLSRPRLFTREAGALAQALVEPQRPGERAPGVGRPADLEVAHHVAVEPPLTQVAAGSAGVGARKEPLVYQATARAMVSTSLARRCGSPSLRSV